MQMFRTLTNGLYTPTLHRVVNVSGRDRVSAPFFYECNFDTVVAPAPQLLAGRWGGGGAEGRPSACCPPLALTRHALRLPALAPPQPPAL